MFQFETNLVFWNVISFGILVVLLTRFALPPILQMMESRKKKIAGDLASAQGDRDKAAELKKNGRQKLDAAIRRADEIVADSRSAADQEKQNVLRAAELHAEKMVEQAKEKIRCEAVNAQAELKKDLAGLVTQVSGKLIQKELTSADHRRLIEENLSRLEQTL